ncbi:MAG TPA: inositol monophosphatase family protein [Candidatus Dormibacteraeota bacterium]|nr:inositol monophosphatase family protein [Candidatus Dormibacteraeota bacterium]
MTALRSLALETAREAGTLLLERFGMPARGLASKSTVTDLVSDADRDAEALIVSRLRAARPDDAIFAEEGTSRAGTSGVSWFVDPLDGTINYLYAVPHWCVTIACADADGALVGIVFDPSRDETFVAERSRGAFLGERRLAVSSESDLGRALVATGFGYDAELRRRQGATIARVLPRVRDVRRFGAAALDLAWVAAGRFDGYFETGVNAWDVEAGILLVREAGGHVTRLEGIGEDRRPAVLATNARLHESLRAALP